MDLRKLKTLIDLVSESNVSELEITEAEGKVRIVKGGPAQVQAAHAPMAMPAPAAPAPALAASLAGFLVVGLFDSLLDVPRLAWLYYLLLLTALLKPRGAA